MKLEEKVQKIIENSQEIIEIEDCVIRTKDKKDTCGVMIVVEEDNHTIETLLTLEDLKVLTKLAKESDINLIK